MVKIAAGAGHGGRNSTAGKRTPDGEYEWNFNDAVLRAMIAKLNEYEDVEILRVDDATGKTDVPLQTRTSRLNAWKADVYVSIHHNANTGKWGAWTGVETYVYEDARAESQALAKAVHPRLVDAMGLRDRGIKKANFHDLRESNCPAILTEGGYMDSTIDIDKMRDSEVLRKAGEGIALGLVAHFGLKPKVIAEVKPVSKPKPTPVVIKEENDMLEKAIVIGTMYDYAAAEVLSVRLKAPIFPRNAIKGEVAKELIVVSGDSDGLVADKITNITGKDRFETASNVAKYLRK